MTCAVIIYLIMVLFNITANHSTIVHLKWVLFAFGVQKKKKKSAPPSLCGQLCGSWSTSPKQTASRPPRSQCWASKCIVALRHCLLIKTSTEEDRWRPSVQRERHPTPVKASIQMKGISRQTAAFEEQPSPPASVCSAAGVWQSVCLFGPRALASGEASLPSVPALQHQKAGSLS